MNPQTKILFKAADTLKGDFSHPYKYAGNPDKTHEYRNAGIVTTNDISDITAVVILQEVLGRARPKYNLRNICRVIPMDQLVCTIDIASGLTVQEKVAEMVEADISKETYTNVDFKLWKNVGRVAASDESQMMARHPALEQSINECARDLPRVENKQIKECVEADITEKESSAIYSDWGAVTAGASDTDPMIAITTHIDHIQGNGYPVDFMAMHPKIWGKFIRNTYIRNLVQSGIMNVASTGGSFTLPGYPNVRIVTDYALTATPAGSIGPILGSSQGLVLGKGPTMAARYRNEIAGYDGYIIRDWLQPQVVIDDALSKICT